MERKYFETIKTGKNEVHEVIICPTCHLCNARDDKGKSMRAAIDKYALTHSYTDIQKYAQMYSVDNKITINAVKTHLNKHSAYIATVKEHIKNLAESTAMDKLDTMEERLDPDEVISDIITIGGQKVKTGDIPVDRFLLMGALKEQGARRKFGSLRDVLEGLDKVRFGELPVQEGKLIEDGTTSETSKDIQG